MSGFVYYVVLTYTERRVLYRGTSLVLCAMFLNPGTVYGVGHTLKHAEKVALTWANRFAPREEGTIT